MNDEQAMLPAPHSSEAAGGKSGAGDAAAGPTAAASGRRLSADDAVEIWIARWLRVRRKDLVVRFGCDPRQLYAIWWGERHPESRARAEAIFKVRHPALVDRVSFGYRRIPKGSRVTRAEGQLDLFSGSGPCAMESAPSRSLTMPPCDEGRR